MHGGIDKVAPFQGSLAGTLSAARWTRAARFGQAFVFPNSFRSALIPYLSGVPDRVGAAASFHGGGLVTDQDTSPHLLIPDTQAHVLHAIAENDDEKNPEAKNILSASYAAAGIPAEIEVYEGTLHGWCPPDSRVYNEEQAERAWARMLVLFDAALA